MSLTKPPGSMNLWFSQTTAFSRFSSIPSGDLEGQLRVEMVGSPNRPATTALCAKRTAGFDVERTARIML
jgi:hypothetical protein